MTLKQLEYFYHICDDPRLINTAKKLDISQPAISLAIKALEDELHEKLFSRIGKRLVLNERGRIFKEQTYQHYLALRDAGNMFRAHKVSGDLFIAASKTFNTYLIPGILFDFQVRFPEVHIKKRSTNSAHIINALKSGTYDAGFVESCFEEPDLVKVPIGSDELIVVTSDKSLAAGSRYIDTVLHRKWILREKGSGTRDIFLDRLDDIGLEPDIFLELPEFEEIKSILVDNKQAISCLSRLAVKKELNRGELFQVRMKNLSFRRELFIVYLKNRYKTLLFREFVAFVKERFNLQHDIQGIADYV